MTIDARVHEAAPHRDELWDSQPIREPERYGDVRLSVQASRYHYCTPRTDGLALSDYLHVEIAVLADDGTLVRPSKFGIRGFNSLFDPGDSPVAGYVSHDDLARLRQALLRREQRLEKAKAKAKAEAK